MDTLSNEVSISIKKAQLSSIHIHLKDDGVRSISVYADLMTSNGHRITQVDFGTESYNDNTKLDISECEAYINSCIGEMVSLLKPMIVRKINGLEKLLPVSTE